MKCLFIHTEPSQGTKQFLEAHGWDYATLKKPPTKPRANPEELVVFAPKNLDDLKLCEKLRKALPESWLAVIFRSNWWGKSKDDPVELSPLAEADELWARDHWEDQLCLSLSRLQRHFLARHELSTLQMEADALKKDCEELSKHSSKVVGQLERDIELATSIQRTLLPQKLPELPGVQLKSRYIPASGPGGDYYDVFEFGDRRRLGILVADSKSHGMAASLLTVLIKIRLEELKERFQDSKSFVSHLNDEIHSVHKKELASLSLLYGILDRQTLTFQYTVAGHVSPLLWRLEEKAPLATAHNPAIGEGSPFEFKESFISLKPADLLLFTTDGLDAPLNVNEDISRETRLASLLKDNAKTEDLLAVQNDILARVNRYKEETELEDDITFLQLFIEPQALYVASESK